MDTLNFLLRFNLLVVLFMVVYYLLISPTVYHRFKRIYLLITPVMALLVALVATLDWNAASLVYIELPLQEINAKELTATGTQWTWSQFLLCAWLLGSVVQAFRFVKALKSVIDLTKNQSLPSSFTFLKYVHIDPSLDKTTSDKVALHEQVHADQWHSIDLLWYSLLGIVFWFNPFIAMGRAALKVVHEHIADAATSACTDDYANTLLAAAFGLSNMPMANEFNSINVKNRIRMLNRKKTKKQRNRIIGALATVLLIAGSVACTTVEEEGKKGKVYEKVDEMPRYSGCEDQGLEGEALDKCALNELYSYMGSNINYPKSAEKEGVEGKVLVEYVINTQGAVTNAKVVKSVDPRLDAEALRVINAMADWTPGIHEGKKVKVQMALPIMFKLTD